MHLALNARTPLTPPPPLPPLHLSPAATPHIRREAAGRGKRCLTALAGRCVSEKAGGEINVFSRCVPLLREEDSAVGTLLGLKWEHWCSISRHLSNLISHLTDKGQTEKPYTSYETVFDRSPGG